MQISNLFASNPLGPKVREISMRDRERMFFLMEQMLRSGQTVESSLRVVAKAFKQEKKEDISLGLTGIAQKVSQGRPLARALESEYIMFNDIHRAAIMAGEASNNMYRAFEILRELEAKKMARARASLAELLTPAALLTLSLISLLNTGLNTLPALAQAAEAQRKTVGAIPQTIMDVSRFCADNWYLFLATLIVSVVMFFSFTRTPQGRYWLDTYVLKLPIYGQYVSYTVYANMLMYFPHLIASGVKPKQMIPIMEALATNQAVRRKIDLFNQTITTGGQMSDAMERAGFPAIAVTPVRVSEHYAGSSRTGTNDAMIDGMNHSREIMERDLMDTSNRFVTVASTILWILGGGIMLFDMLSIISTQQF